MRMLICSEEIQKLLNELIRWNGKGEKRMFTAFNSESLWIGTDLKRFNEIRDVLDWENIKYKYKVKDQLGEWTGSGTIRGRVGSAGNPAEQAKQYEILVDKKNLEQARFVLQK